MSTYTIEVPNWHPALLNRLLNSHPMARGRIKADDLQMISTYGYMAKVPKATGKRSMQLIIILAKGQRAADPDGYFKSLNDALVNLGYLVDDNRTKLELLPVIFKRGVKATTITLTDI